VPVFTTAGALTRAALAALWCLNEKAIIPQEAASTIQRVGLTTLGLIYCQRNG